jgi:hypothetical protein
MYFQLPEDGFSHKPISEASNKTDKVLATTDCLYFLSEYFFLKQYLSICLYNKISCAV